MGLIADRMAVLGTENAFKVGEDIARAEKRGVNVIRFTWANRISPVRSM